MPRRFEKPEPFHSEVVRLHFAEARRLASLVVMCEGLADHVPALSGVQVMENLPAEQTGYLFTRVDSSRVLSWRGVGKTRVAEYPGNVPFSRDWDRRGAPNVIGAQLSAAC